MTDGTLQGKKPKPLEKQNRGLHPRPDDASDVLPIAALFRSNRAIHRRRNAERCVGRTDRATCCRVFSWLYALVGPKHLVNLPPQKVHRMLLPSTASHLFFFFLSTTTCTHARAQNHLPKRSGGLRAPSAPPAGCCWLRGRGEGSGGVAVVHESS